MPSLQQRCNTAFQTSGIALRGSFLRGVPLQYQKTPLSAIGSILSGGRYNAIGSFEVLYLGENVDTVIHETRLIVRDDAGKLIPRPQAPKIIMTIAFELQRVFDLTNASIYRKLLKVTQKSLRAEWTDIVDAGAIPETHTIGSAAQTNGIEALIVPSARKRGSTNLAVFPDNLLRGSFVEIYEPVGFPPRAVTRLDGKK